MPTAAAPAPATRLAIPLRISRETRELLPAPDLTLAEINAAIDTYVAAKARENAAKKEADAARDVILPVAREAFARLWCARSARPKAPVSLESYTAHVGYVVEERRGASLDERSAERLEDAIGAEAFTELVIRSKAYRFDDTLLADGTIRKKLKAAIDECGLFSPDEKAALFKEVPAYAFRTSTESALGAIAQSGWSALTRALAALSGIARQYLALPKTSEASEASVEASARRAS